MAQSQRSSVVEVRQKAEANSHVEAVDEGPSNVFVHVTETVSSGTGVNRMSVSDVHEFVGMAVCTADISLRRLEDTGDGWFIVLKKE